MSATTPVPPAVVYFNNRYVETDDPTHVSLQALCGAFELSEDEMDLAFIRCRNTQHVVATLPQDTLPAEPPGEQGGLPAAYELIIRGQKVEGEASVKVEKGVGSTDQEMNLNALSHDPSGMATDALKNEYLNDAKGPNDQNGNSSSPPPTAQSTQPDGEEEREDGLEETLLQLAQLGVVPLLGKQDPRFSALDPYQPSMSPGLLTGIVYPASLYSPYRLQRDPLMKANVQQQLQAHRQKQVQQQQQQRAGGTSAPTANPVSLPPAGTNRKVKYTVIGVDYRTTTAPYRSTSELYENTLKADFVDQFLEQEERRLAGDATLSATANINADSSSPVVNSPDTNAARAFPSTKREREEAVVRYRPDLIAQSEEQTKDLLDGLMAVAAQAKAAFTLADLNEKKNKPEDIKPKLEDLQS